MASRSTSRGSACASAARRSSATSRSRCPAGSWVCAIGPNGAGKTTLLHAVAGLVPFEGRVDLWGRELGAYPRRERARLVALVPQQPVIPEGVTVQDYVLLGRTPHLGVLGTRATIGSGRGRAGARAARPRLGGRATAGHALRRRVATRGPRPRARAGGAAAAPRRADDRPGPRPPDPRPRAGGRAPSRARPDGPVDDARPHARGTVRRSLRAALAGPPRVRGNPRGRAQRAP